jgi:hypothetical protein
LLAELLRVLAWALLLALGWPSLALRAARLWAWAAQRQPVARSYLVQALLQQAAQSLPAGKLANLCARTRA